MKEVRGRPEPEKIKLRFSLFSSPHTMYCINLSTIYKLSTIPFITYIKTFFVTFIKYLTSRRQSDFNLNTRTSFRRQVLQEKTTLVNEETIVIRRWNLFTNREFHISIEPIGDYPSPLFSLSSITY